MKRASSWCVGAALGAATTCLGGMSAAAPTGPSPIDLTVSDCVDISLHELRRLLDVELAGRAATLAPPSEALGGTRVQPERIAVECRNSDTESVASISLTEFTSGRTVSRVIGLVDVPARHRARLLAIAIVELMSETNSTTTMTADHSEGSRVAPPLSQTLVADMNASRGTRTRWRVDAVAMTLRTSGLDPFLWGGMGRASIDLSDWIAGEVDVGSAGNSVPISLGTAGIVLVLAGVSAIARVGRGPLEWNSGIGLRGGLVRLAGSPANGSSTAHAAAVEGRTVLAPWGGPFVTTRLAMHAGHHLSFLLGLEGGSSVTQVVGRVDGVTEVAIARWWVGLSFGAGWSL